MGGCVYLITALITAADNRRRRIKTGLTEAVKRGSVCIKPIQAHSTGVRPRPGVLIALIGTHALFALDKLQIGKRIILFSSN